MSAIATLIFPFCVRLRKIVYIENTRSDLDAQVARSGFARRGTAFERDPPRRRGTSLVPALREVGIEGLRPRRLLDRGGKLQRCALRVGSRRKNDFRP